MSKGVNKVILIGNLGNDPEIRYTSISTAIANLSIATSESWIDKNTGQKQEKTEWHRVVIFGKLAEIAQQYLKKGSKVYIEGKLQTRKWQDQEGRDRYSTEILVDFNGQMQMLDSRDQKSSPQNSNFNTTPKDEYKSFPSSVQQNPSNSKAHNNNQSSSQTYNETTKQQKFNEQNNTMNNNSTNFDQFDDDIPF